MKQVYYNGTCYSLDKDNHSYEALVVEEGKLVFLGTSEDALKIAGDEAEQIDLEGHYLYPGFYDSHSHFSMSGAFYHHMCNLSAKPIGEVGEVSDAIKQLKVYIGQHPDKKLYMAWGFNDEAIKEKRGLLMRELDEASKEVPILVLHVSGHIAYGNRKLFELAGYHKGITAPKGGSFGYDENGDFDGKLEENAFMQIPLPEPYFSEMITGFMGSLESLEAISKHYLSKGITTASEGGGMGVYSLNMINQGMRDGKVKGRLVIQPFYPQYEESFAFKDLDRKITLQGVKLIGDGSIQCQTAFLSEPYLDSESLGYPAMSSEAMEKIILDLYEKGQQPVVHTNGDGTIDLLLDALEKAEEAYPNQNLRPVFIHAQMAREDQLERMKALGAVASFFHLHVYYWGDLHKNCYLGKARAENLNPLAWAEELGLCFTTHTDTPVVPQSPLLSIWSATKRETMSGEILGAHQVLSPLEALKTYTTYPAYQNHEEALKGTLEMGKYGDMVVLDRDILNCPLDEIKVAKVLYTIVDGEVVYSNY